MSNSRFTTDTEALPRLLYIAHSRYGSDWLSIPHSHPFSEFAFICSGSGVFVIDSFEFPVQEGMLVTVQPNLIHTERPHQGASLEYFIMGVENLVIHSLYDKLSPVCELGNAQSKIGSLFSSIYEEMRDHKPGCVLMAQSLLLELIALLLRRMDMTADAVSPLRIRRGCAAVKNFIDERYAEPLSLDTLCGLCNISKFHLIHEFTRQVGMPPIAYLVRKRLSEARILLSTTEMSIALVAMAVGFSSASQFSQRFKKEAGMSPARFRMQQKLGSAAKTAVLPYSS